MRVYGTSPLYNYFELVFRSKRLFIGSMIIASLATTFFYFYKSNSYTAHTLVLLTGTEQPNPEDKEQKGTIQYKVSILNLELKDPDFIKRALRVEGMDQNMTGEQFEQFAKNVREKVNFGVADNVLEISCTWPDARAANIVNAIYGAYSRKVLDEETTVSQTNTKLVSDLLQEYTDQLNKVEKRVTEYQKLHALNMSIDPGSATNAYQQADYELTRLKAEQVLALDKFQLLKDQFARTNPKITESTVFRGPGKDPTYVAAQQAQIDAKGKLEELKLKYTDNDPRVKAAQQRLDAANDDLKKFVPNASAAKKPTGLVLNQTESVNPAYQNLQERIKQTEIDLKGLNRQVLQAERKVELARNRAVQTPDEQYRFRHIADRRELYANFQNQFAIRLETAKMDEKRDKAYKLQEIKQVVKPESEQENKGIKGMLILVAGPFLGLIVAFAFSLLAEALDHSVRTPIEVEQFLGKPVLAVLPRIKTPSAGSRRQLGGSDAVRPSLPSTEA